MAVILWQPLIISNKRLLSKYKNVTDDNHRETLIIILIRDDHKISIKKNWLKKIEGY